jgi:HEAT repeat protein
LPSKPSDAPFAEAWLTTPYYEQLFGVLIEGVGLARVAPALLSSLEEAPGASTYQQSAIQKGSKQTLRSLGQEGLPIVKRAACDANAGARQSAMDILGSLGRTLGDSVVEDIVTHLNDTNYSVRRSAVNALEVLVPRSAEEPLKHLLKLTPSNVDLHWAIKSALEAIQRRRE